MTLTNSKTLSISNDVGMFSLSKIILLDMRREQSGVGVDQKEFKWFPIQQI